MVLSAFQGCTTVPTLHSGVLVQGRWACIPMLINSCECIAEKKEGVQEKWIKGRNLEGQRGRDKGNTLWNILLNVHFYLSVIPIHYCLNHFAEASLLRRKSMTFSQFEATPDFYH